MNPHNNEKFSSSSSPVTTTTTAEFSKAATTSPRSDKDPMTSADDDVIENKLWRREEEEGSRADGRSRMKKCVGDNLLLILTCVGILLGFAIGFVGRQFHPSKDALMWIGMPGELFLRMLKLMILPLIVSTVITGTASLDPKANGKISAVAFTFIVVTNVIACVIAALLCLLIKPGEGQLSSSAGLVNQESMETQDIFADLLRNVFPDNIIEAAFQKARTRYRREEVEVELAVNGTYSSNTINTTSSNNNNNTNNATVWETVATMTRYHSKTDGVNVLGLVVICTVIGIAINSVKDKASVFLSFFHGATDIVLVIIRGFFWLTPVGVASLIGVSVAGVAHLGSAFSQLGRFVLVVSLGMVLHTFLVLPLILVTLARRNPFTYLLSVARPVVIGFATTSTAVAIPEMLESCERKNQIDSRLARFVIPFCVTLNADGSALYITSSAIFIAQLTGVDVGAREIFVIGLLTAVAAMAIPSVPSASIVTLVIILTSLNIPANDIALLFAVEWYLMLQPGKRVAERDRIRTSCNVVSHTFCAAVTYRFCKGQLTTTPPEAQGTDHYHHRHHSLPLDDLCDVVEVTTSDTTVITTV